MRHIEKQQYRIIDGESDMNGHFVQEFGCVPSMFTVRGNFLLSDLISQIAEAGYDVVTEWRRTDRQTDRHTDSSYRDASYMTLRKSDAIHLMLSLSEIMFVEESTWTPYEIPVTAPKTTGPDGRPGRYVVRSFELLYAQDEPRVQSIFDKLLSCKLSSGMLSMMHLLCQDNDGILYTKEMPVDPLKLDFDLDTNYGSGFTEFHNAVLRRVKSRDKGILLLHGDPGTGKTFYIRRLLHDLGSADRNFLYLPANMLGMLGTPKFNDFIIEWSINEGKPLVIIVEDADRMLLRRDGLAGNDADAVSNLLNMTDGLLNDLLKTQVIATFNVNVRSIDEAILRKQRIIALRRFGPLDKSTALSLIGQLGLQPPAEQFETMTLAEVYALATAVDDHILVEPHAERLIGLRI